MNQINIVFILVFLLFCWVGKVYSKDKTIYVTVTVNSTNEAKPTSVAEEIEIPTVDVEDTEEYKHFEKALDQAEGDDCLYYLNIISLNLFHANKIGNSDCENKYYDPLKSLKNKNPCSDKGQVQYVAEYMNAQINLLCHTYDTGKKFTESLLPVKEMCPIIHHLKTNYTKYHDVLFEGCSKIEEDNIDLDSIDSSKYPNIYCINEILKDYSEMENIRGKLNNEYKEKFTYESKNETISFKMNITNALFDELEKKCPLYSSIKSSGVVSMAISLSTVLIFSLFIMFINM